jgi:beta-N-acetylhexosaminidase
LGFEASESVIGDRSFGTNPVQVAEFVRQAVRSLQKSGVCAVIKHYPGHGRSNGDSHFGKQTIPVSWETLIEQDLVPFQAAIDEGVGGMMTAHIQYPMIDPDGVPVSLSRKLIQEKLRIGLRYEGLVITDALDMQGVLAVSSSEKIAVQSLRSGVDMLLSPESPKKIVIAIKQAIDEGRLDKKDIELACRRVLETKNRFGILGNKAAFRSELVAKAILGSAVSQKLIWAMFAGRERMDSGAR